MEKYDPFEFLFMLVLFGGIFGLIVYGFGRAAWESLKRQPRDKELPPLQGSTGSILMGLAAGAFLLWLFGSLFFGMLGFDTGFR